MRLINFIGQDYQEYYKDFIETIEYLQDQNIVTDIELNSSFFTDEKYKNLLDEYFLFKTFSSFADTNSRNNSIDFRPVSLISTEYSFT